MFDSKKILLMSAVCSVFALSSCLDSGEYEPILYKGFPYDNARTAGSGVSYVRMNMLPAKGNVIGEMDSLESMNDSSQVESESSASSGISVEKDEAEEHSEEEYPDHVEQIFKEMQMK